MSRNELTLICPKCNVTFLHTPTWANPVCPTCGYARNNNASLPKFKTFEANK